MSQKIHIPLSVPKTKEKEYIDNYNLITHGTGNLMMFAGDQKVEHLNDDFVGKNIPKEVADPEHYFKIAEKAKIGVFATQMGLLSFYGRDYPKIPYLIKMNSKTNLLTKQYKDPFSDIWIHLDEILEFKKQSKLNIVGVGYTIYLGSWYESNMFNQAAHLIYQAHKNGLIVVLWMYPRGVAVKNEKDIHLIAGGAGVAACLGADFVKVNYPYSKCDKYTAEKFKEVVNAAGRSKVICVGGSKMKPKKFLKNIYNQKHTTGTYGNAIGRNIYQNNLDDAVNMANAVSAITLENKSAEEAYNKYLKNEKKSC
ncbi:aldolase [Candidatus Parcubacteria bacterium]|nr:aldolase [Candidatus Parcubacteria bacterium]